MHLYYNEPIRTDIVHENLLFAIKWVWSAYNLG